MVSEKITLFRTNKDKTEVIEQLPKTVASQVYDSENEQFLDTTIEDINTEITNHKAQKGQPNGYASLDANGKVPSSQISIDGGGGVVEDAITTWEETPVQQNPSPEERIAAALEFQALISLPDIAEEEEV